VKELQELFWQAAERYKILPLLGGVSFYFGIVDPEVRRPLVGPEVLVRSGSSRLFQ
jgi:hypothetical protein